SNRGAGTWAAQSALFGSISGALGFHDSGVTMADDIIQYLPPLDTFYQQSMDVYTNTGAFPPAGGNKRVSNVSVLLTGTFPEGHRQKVASTDSYTHIVCCDPSIEIRDPYKGVGVAPGTTLDYLAIPAGQTNNYWKVVYSLVTTIPGMGQKRIVFCDRWGTPGV